MRKIKLVLVFMCMLSISAVAQKQSNSRSGAAMSTETVSKDTPEMVTKKTDAAHHCKDLHDQLTKLFGKDYSITNPAVISRIGKNIDDKNASFSIRKNSLYIIYGDDYQYHTDRIK